MTRKARSRVLVTPARFIWPDLFKKRVDGRRPIPQQPAEIASLRRGPPEVSPSGTFGGLLWELKPLPIIGRRPVAEREPAPDTTTGTQTSTCLPRIHSRANGNSPIPTWTFPSRSRNRSSPRATPIPLLPSPPPRKPRQRTKRLPMAISSYKRRL